MKKFHLGEPYWSARDKYGWDKKLGRTGISIRPEILKSNTQIEVTIGTPTYEGIRYTLDTALALKLGHPTQAKKDGTHLICFPLSILEVIDAHKVVGEQQAKEVKETRKEERQETFW